MNRSNLATLAVWGSLVLATLTHLWEFGGEGAHGLSALVPSSAVPNQPVAFFLVDFTLNLVALVLAVAGGIVARGRYPALATLALGMVVFLSVASANAALIAWSFP